MAAGAGERIAAAVLGWPGVETRPHRFGGREYRLGGRELGHVHGDELADLPFPVRVRDRLVAEGQALPHHILPDTGWVSRWLRSPADVDAAISLFRLQYERLASAPAQPAAGGAPTSVPPGGGAPAAGDGLAL